MANYQSVLTINVQHEYYNAHQDELAPVVLYPDQQTQSLLKQYGMLLKNKPGSSRLIADTDLFNDLAKLTEEFTLRYYIIGADPVIRSITKMPDMFSIANITARFDQDTALEIAANSWLNANQPNGSSVLHDTAIYDRNILGILDVHIPMSHFNLEAKTIAVRFETLSTYWKYYIFSFDSKKNLSISSTLNGNPPFTEQEQEQFSGRVARIFLSTNEIPLKKVYSDSLSLLNEKRILINSLPWPAPGNLSASAVEDQIKIISHIYVS
ncbi:hypothetical protein EGM70_05480 [Enterobacteriaceae bacterium 89]|nr:hypothetical protein [Enterobacteriaceae bacterium 89]